MKVYLVKKEKHKIYKSDKIVLALFDKELRHDDLGAPTVDDGYISISDNKDYWICALSQRPVGVDIESLSRTVTPNITKRLHAKEQEYLSALSFGTNEWKEEFLIIWTKKECYSKREGKGIALGYTRFSVIDDDALFSVKYKNQIISATEEIEIENAEYTAPMEKSALEAGADILDMFGCSSEKLKSKLLERGYQEEEAQNAIDVLLERGYLNDDEYSRSLSQKYAARGYSSRRIAFELEHKGVAKEIAKNRGDQYKDSDYARASKEAEKLKGNKEADDKLKAKIARKLASLGYNTSDVYDIVSHL